MARLARLAVIKAILLHASPYLGNKGLPQSSGHCTNALINSIMILFFPT
jgi:hypothetical protein